MVLYCRVYHFLRWTPGSRVLHLFLPEPEFTPLPGTRKSLTPQCKGIRVKVQNLNPERMPFRRGEFHQLPASVDLLQLYWRFITLTVMTGSDQMREQHML